MRPQKWVLSSVLSAFVLLSVGCFSYHPIPPPPPGEYGSLKVVTRNGDEYKMTRVHVDSTTVTGRRGGKGRLEFPLEQVGVFEERRFSVGKTLGLAVISVPAGLGMLVLLWLAEGD